MVREVIALFGVSRAFFASNFPVDKWCAGASLPELYAGMHRLVEDMPEADRVALFYGNAATLYRAQQ
jgi:predicted TIM-barrel fold metal-dependent hydrolase